MKAETLHDAIGLLSADLVAEADRMRQGKHRVIRWKRYAAMAACFAVVLSCSLFALGLLVPGGAMEQAVESAAAPMEAPAAAAPKEEPAAAQETAPEENGSGVSGGTGDRTAGALPDQDGTYRYSSIETPIKPSTACFGSNARITLVRSRQELDSYLEQYDWMYRLEKLQEACGGYDADWFAQNDLLLVALHGSGGVTSVTERDGIWEIRICGTLPEKAPEFHFLLEAEKGEIPGADAVVLITE